MEILFQKGLVKILFATETFAVGVNMPTRSVVFTELEKYTNGGKRFLNTAEYKQMSGRAGRRGIDTVGYSIILPLHQFPDESDIKLVLTGKVPRIVSKFNIDYNFILKSLVNNTLDSNIIGKSLKEQEKELIKLGIQKELVLINDSISKIDISSFNENNKDFKKIKFLIEQENQTKKFSDMGITYNMNNKDKKEYSSIQKDLKYNNEFKIFYENYIKYSELINSKKKNENDLTYLKDENDIIIQSVLNILRESGYVDCIEDKYILLQKGIIASQINECNSLIFTEMITSGIFDELTDVEIVSLLSIFIDDKSDDDVFKSELVYAHKLSDKVSKIEKIIETFISLENKNQMFSSNDFWNISVNNMDATHLWASGGSILQIKSEGLIKYEGNFIRNITKLYNITDDVITISKLIGKVDLLPKLENIPQLIIRDVVNLSSLYFI